MAEQLARALAPSPPPHTLNYSHSLNYMPGNHWSPSGCFETLDRWFNRTLRSVHRPFQVLDVGGGTGEKTLKLRDTYRDTAHTFECVDVASGPGSPCQRIDGERLPYADLSQHIVFFSYVLHHAADHTLALLQEAKRVARRGAYIVVLEDLKADTVLMQRAEAVHLGCTPGREPCIFRGDREWRAIFQLLRLHLVDRLVPSRFCARPIPRALYILQQDERLDGTITLVSGNVSSGGGG